MFGNSWCVAQRLARCHGTLNLTLFPSIPLSHFVFSNGIHAIELLLNIARKLPQKYMTLDDVLTVVSSLIQKLKDVLHRYPWGARKQ